MCLQKESFADWTNKEFGKPWIKIWNCGVTAPRLPGSCCWTMGFYGWRWSTRVTVPVPYLSVIHKFVTYRWSRAKYNHYLISFILAVMILLIFCSSIINDTYLVLASRIRKVDLHLFARSFPIFHVGTSHCKIIVFIGIYQFKKPAALTPSYNIRLSNLK